MLATETEKLRVTCSQLLECAGRRCDREGEGGYEEGEL